MNIKLSFIIPFYNVEKYIAQCLDSLLAQDIPHSEYEIICVNDCSPDNSRAVILEYQQKYSNIVLIEHEVNKRLGGARNTGIDSARGKYLWFVDSDDHIKPDCLKNLLLACEKDTLDILMFNFERVDDNGNVILQKKIFPDSSVMSGLDYVNQPFGGSLVSSLGYAWRSIYRTDYLKENGFVFPEYFWEDIVFVPKGLLLASRVKSLKEIYYEYRVNDNSISCNNNRYKGDQIFQFVFKAGIDLRNFAKEFQTTDRQIALWLEKRSHDYHFNSFAMSAVKATIKEKRYLYSLMSQHRDVIKDMRKQMNLMNRLLSDPHFGFACSLMLTPLQRFWRNIILKCWGNATSNK